MPKSADAFRTISEVADWLETPAHVLRFWESKFSQVKPVKRAGGRRYYRPADMQLLGGIKKLLHDDGMTIKGVQKILREHGIKHVAALSQPLDEVTEIEASEIAQDVQPDEAASGTVLSFDRDAEISPPEAEPEAEVEQEQVIFAHSRSEPEPDAEPEPEPEPEADTQKSEPPAMPSFLNRRAPAADTRTPDAAPPEPHPPARPSLDLPDDPKDDIVAPPGVLTALASKDGVSKATARQLSDLAARLKSLRA